MAGLSRWVSSARGLRSARSRAASGYQVAWKNGALDQYVAWNVDSSGNFLSQGAALAGTSCTLESFETAFSQDLNGDGTTGPTTASIEAIGSTTLTKVATPIL